MKILVIGLDGAVPELLFGDERLTNLRRLMEEGCYGKLESIIPPTAIPAWLSMATGQDPGSLGIYGSRNRVNRSYKSEHYRDMELTLESALWTQVGRQGKRSVLVDVPASANARWENTERVGEYSVVGKDFPTSDRNQRKDEIYDASRNHFENVRRHLKNPGWDYFQFIEIGLDHLQHAFWQFHDPQHGLYRPGNPYESVIREYYLYLDDEIGKLLKLLDEDTAILVVSDHGAQRLDGRFCLNEWLLEEELLVLNEYPDKITPFYNLNVKWEETEAWSEGEYCASVFFNVKGREPIGTIDSVDFEAFRDAIKSRFETLTDQEGRSLGTRVFKPEDIYKSVRNIAPDLIVQFGEHWRSIGSVGHGRFHVQENDTGPDDCNHAQFGSFILAASNNPLRGEVEHARLLDIAPTLLELGGYDIPTSMQGKSLMAGKTLDTATDTVDSEDDEEAIREHLKGLGYI